MTSVKIYRSSDVGAPVLGNIAGSLIGVLDACLVNGFADRQVTSISRIGSVATATLAGHGYHKFDTVLVSGATQTEYNGTVKVTEATADTFSYAIVGTPTTPATGTINAKKPGAGWTKEFTGTNKAAYRMGPGSNLHYLRVDDTGLTSAECRGYESMSSVDAGTAAFPTTTQMNVSYWWKADAAARDWMVIATDRILYYWHDYSNTQSSRYLWMFGQIRAYKADDAFGSVMFSTNQPNASYSYYYPCTVESHVGTTGSFRFLARTYNQSGSSVPLGFMGDYSKMRGTTYIGHDSPTTYGIQYPHGPDAGLYVTPLYITENPGTPVIRGEMPGLWCPLHYASAFNHGDVFGGTGDMAGKYFMIAHVFTTSSQKGAFAIELSDTWAT